MKREVAASKAEVWRELILRQKKTGLTVEAFCQQQSCLERLFAHLADFLRESRVSAPG